MNRTGIYCSFLAKKMINQYLVTPRITAHLQSVNDHTSLLFCQHPSLIHTSPSQYAGHNKWSKIKRKKAVADIERSQQIHRVIQQIVFAAKAGGTIDPDKNLKLSSLIDQARSAGIPKSNIESALKRASSKGESNSAESVLLDGRGPGGSLLLIEALTDNIRRTRPKIRTLMEKKGGVLGDPGSSAFNFEHKALIQVPTTSLPADTDPLELAIEIGAEDVCTVSKEESDGVSSEAADSTTAKSGDSSSKEDSSAASSDYQFKCDVSDMRQVVKSLRDKGAERTATTVEYLPKNTVELSEKDYESACELVDALCEYEETVEVYSNFVLAGQATDS